MQPLKTISVGEDLQKLLILKRQIHSIKMGLTQYRKGLPFVAFVSLVAWLASGAANICMHADYAYPVPTDARLYGCDNQFTRNIRILTGDLFRTSSYDLVYDPYLSYLWLLGIGLVVWYLGRTLALRRQTVTTSSR